MCEHNGKAGKIAVMTENWGGKSKNQTDTITITIRLMRQKSSSNMLALNIHAQTNIERKVSAFRLFMSSHCHDRGNENLKRKQKMRFELSGAVSFSSHWLLLLLLWRLPSFLGLSIREMSASTTSKSIVCANKNSSPHYLSVCTS